MIKPNSPKNEAQRIQVLKEYNILDTLPEQVYEDVAAIATQICDTPMAMISLIDENRQWIKAKEGVPESTTELSREYSYCAHAILEPDEIMEVPNASLDERFADNPLSTGEPHIQFYAGAPLTTEDGLVLGTVCVVDHKPKKLTEIQKESLKALARQVMALLELRKKTQDFETNQTRLQRLVDNISDIAYEINEVGQFIFVNPSLIKITGYSEEELLSKSYYDLVHPDYLEKLGQFYYEQIKSGSGDSYYEFPILTKDGGIVWLGQTIKIFYDGDRVDRVGAFAKNITELKATRQDLRKRESLYRLLSENSRNFVSLQDNSGLFKYASPSVEKLTGYKQEEFYKLLPMELVHPDDAQRLNEGFGKVLMGEDQKSEFRIRHKDGFYSWIESHARPIFGDDGKVIEVQTSTLDITERKEREIQRRQEQANLKALIENSTDIIWSINRDFKYITFNTLFKKHIIEQIGRNAEIGDKALFMSLPKKTGDYWRNLYGRAFQGERFIEEIRAIKDREIYYECSFNPIIDDNNEVIGVSVFGRDVSRKVQIRIKKQRFQEGLELLNDLSSLTKLDYNDLTQLAIEKVSLLFDMELAVLSKISGEKCLAKHFFDPNSISDFAENPEKLLKDTLCDITYKQQDVLAIGSASESEYKKHIGHKSSKIEAYIGTPVSIGDVKYGTLSLMSLSKRKDTFDNYDKEFFELFGRWIGAILERKKYEQLILESKERAESASMAKEQFLSTMSHEIRTPLNAIIGMTHILLQENPKLSQKENLNILKFSGENLLVLLNDVLDINKIESGKIFLEQSDFNLKELVSSIKSALAYGMGEKGITCDFSYAPDLPEVVMGDSMRISQILNNLLSNAIKFTENGSISIHVENRGISDDLVSIYFEICDTGIGLSEDEIQHIFERFAQAKSSTSREYGGSGLGLTIIKGLLELMGGEIMVESTPDVGSKFSFELKLPLSDRLDVNSGPVSMPNLQNVSIRNVSLLLVEDNKVNQVVSSKFLNRWGITVTVANNGEEAVALFKKMSFDIILMDLQMPIMDGYEATELIRETDKEIPILALTASVRIGKKNKAMQVGMNDFLIKPLNPHDLYLKISKYIVKENIVEIKDGDRKPSISIGTEFYALREFLDGDEDFKNEILPLYISNIRTIKSRLPVTIVNGDEDAADKLRHKMQTTLHTLGATEIRTLMDQGIKLIDQEENESDLKGFVERLTNACNDLEIRLENFLN